MRVAYLRQLLEIMGLMALVIGHWSPTFAHEFKFNPLIINGDRVDLSVTDILQDRDGFIWFATLNGLYRYDGYQLRGFKQERGSDREGLAHNLVFALHQDRAGMLWIGTQEGLSRFDPIRESFTNFRHDPNHNQSLPNDRVISLCEDSNGRLWVGTRSGLAYRMPDEDHFRSIPALVGQAVWSIAQDQRNRLWLGTDTGLLRANAGDLIPETVEPDRIGDTAIYRLYTDSKHNLWIGTRTRGLYCLDLNTDALNRFAPDGDVGKRISGPFITSIYEEPNGTIWVGTDGQGLNSLEPELGSSFTSYVHMDHNDQSLSNDQVLAIQRDRSGLIWFGTLDGVSILNPHNAQFHNLHADLENGFALTDHRVWSILVDHQSMIWVGTWDGLTMVDNSQGSTHWRKDTNPNGLNNSEVIALFEDSDQQFWIGTRDGLHKRQGEFGSYRFDHLLDPDHGEGQEEIYRIAQDRFGQLWLTGNKGLKRVDPKLATYLPAQAEKLTLDQSALTVIFKDSGQRLWIGSATGLAQMIQTNQSAPPEFHVYTREQHPSSLYDNYIVSLGENRQGELLVGTTYGLDVLRFENERIIQARHYTEEKGLADSIVFGVLEDDQGFLWLSTSGGLNRINPDNDEIRVFSRQDGLVCREYNQFAYHKSSSGMVYFGGDHGVDYFRPANLENNTYAPPIVFTSVKTAFTEADLPEGINHSPQLDVLLKDNYISLEFAALDFHAPERNQYAYLLEGNHDSWIEPGTNRTATYTNLAAGTYRFRVKATNSAGLWHERSLPLTIHIIPPFYMTNWFKTTLVVLVILLLYLGHRTRLRRIKHQKENLRQMVVERTRELDQEKSLLENINVIVGSINSKMEFSSLLATILRETRGSAGYACALIHRRETDTFKYMVTLPAEAHDPKTELTLEEAETLYLKDSLRLDQNLFSREDPDGSHLLILRVVPEKATEGFFIYRDQRAFESLLVRLLIQLEGHVVAAFNKARALRELKQLNEKKNELLSVVAHDLRSPLSSVLGYADLIYHELQEQGHTGQQTLEDLEFMKQATARILSLLNRLLDISAIEAGHLDLATEPIDIRELIQQTERLFRPRASAKQIHLYVEPGPTVMVTVDGDRLAEVFENLVGNALKYTDSGGEVQLSHELKGGEILVHVRDNGQGIREDELKYVFARYRTLSSQVTENESSSGLGLAIAKKVVELHQGRIWVKSKRGQGSVFSFALPVSPSGHEPVLETFPAASGN